LKSKIQKSSILLLKQFPRQNASGFMHEFEADLEEIIKRKFFGRQAKAEALRGLSDNEGARSVSERD